MKFNCPQCDTQMEGDRAFAGSEVDCPECKFYFVIPSLEDDDTAEIVPPGTPTPTADPSLESNYTLQGQIARGGMGKIVSAHDKKLERHVVVKQLIDPDEDPALVNQLIREAQITARLSHPGIVPIHELGRDAQGRIYYTMKHIRGEPLDKVLDKLREGDPDTIKKCPFQRLLLIFTRVCDTIAYANEMGIVHRDLKPDNIMLAPYGEYLIIDWGIAKDLNNQDPGGEELIASAFRYTPEEGDFGATLHGAVFGSPSYMSPEQAKGEVGAIDARSDVFSLGAMLFEMVTLSPPYEGEEAEEVVKLAAERQIQGISEIRQDRPDPQNPWPHLEGGPFPESVLAVAMKAMEINPDERYQTAEELRSDIEAYLSGHTTAAENAGFFRTVKLAINRNRGLAAALALCLLLAIGSVGFTAAMNRIETRKAKAARIEAERYVERANEAREQSRRTRLEVAPGYLELARLLANRGKVEDALNVAKLAEKYDPRLIEATALVKVLEIHGAITEGTEPPAKGIVGDLPSLSYLLDHPDELNAEPGTHFSEQTYARLERAYSEVGLSRFAALISVEQPVRVDRYRKQLSVAWKDSDLEWDLSLAPELSSLCLDEELRNCFPDYSRWAAQLDRAYPGQVLHLEIGGGSNIPDLSILSNLAVESISIQEGTEITDQQIKALANCRSLKVVSLNCSGLADHSFLDRLSNLVSLHIGNHAGEIDLSPLHECESLQVFSTGGDCRIVSLASLSTADLHFFSGCAGDGDYSPLSGMPLQFLDIRNGDQSTTLESLENLPVQTFVARGIDIQRNWNTITSWPLKHLSIDSDYEINVSGLTRTLPQLTCLQIVRGRWRGNAGKLFPALEALIDSDGCNLPSFSGIGPLQTIRIEGNGDSICYLSALEKIPIDKELRIGHDLPVQVLNEAVALSMVKGNWGSARSGYLKIRRRIEKRPELIPATVWVNQLGAVIEKKEDPDEVFVSRKYRRKGSVYQAVFCGLDKTKAERFAVNAGGALAFVDDMAEMEFLSEIARSHPEYGAFWIGGRSETLQPDLEIPSEEALVVPAKNEGKESRPRSGIHPFVIEWKSSGS